MKFKLALLAATALCGATAAQAADLGRPAPAAVDYVKVCDAFGAGFFYIPGSDTCLQIGGYVRFRGFVGGDNWSPAVVGGTYRPTTLAPFSNVAGSRARHNATTQTEASMTFDARTNTELGLLRTFVDARWQINSLAPSNSRNADGSGVPRLDKAYIQFGGLTAGYAESFFDFFTGAAFDAIIEPFWSDHTTNLIAYTFAFGNGISASVALEDPTIGGKRSLGSTAAAFGAPFNSATQTITSGTYGGHKAPDFVANVKIDQAWGSAQIMGALHNDYDNTAAFGDKWGYAIGAGVKFNVPQIGVGDYAVLQAIYSSGTLNYQLLGGIGDDYLRTTNIVGGATGITLTKAWSVNGSLHHGFTKTVSLDLDLGYASVDQAGPNDFNTFRLASDLVWSPVNNLELGVGVEYQSISDTSATKTAYTAANPGIALGNQSAWVGVLHVKRKF